MLEQCQHQRWPAPGGGHVQRQQPALVGGRDEQSAAVQPGRGEQLAAGLGIAAGDGCVPRLHAAVRGTPAQCQSA
jgi:hypothetical protein